MIVQVKALMKHGSEGGHTRQIGYGRVSGEWQRSFGGGRGARHEGGGCGGQYFGHEISHSAEATKLDHGKKLETKAPPTPQYGNETMGNSKFQDRAHKPLGELWKNHILPL